MGFICVTLGDLEKDQRSLRLSWGQRAQTKKEQ